jgi:hypothetical protein
LQLFVLSTLLQKFVSTVNDILATVSDKKKITILYGGQKDRQETHILEAITII